MKESVTYQAIVAEGEAKGEAKGRAEGARQELRKVLLSQGAERFGAPAPSWAAAALAQMENLEQLEALATKLLRAESWDELLPQSRKSPRRKKGGS